MHVDTPRPYDARKGSLVETRVDRANTKPEGATPRPSWSGLAIGAVGTGQRFRRYEIIEVLQRGGMGEVVLAEAEDETGWRSRVVLKRLLADLLDDERYVEMFMSEAQVMSRLNHPNIVKLFDVPEIEGKQCLAMEYVHGKNVHQVIRRCRKLGLEMPLQVGLHIMIEILRGLHYAHTFVLHDGRPLELVHRDVTPGNLLVSFEGDVKITDFGIAKSKMSRLSTTVGVVKGTTRYLSPEQIKGAAATPRSDVFSAASVLVEMLTGTPLFERGSVPTTLFAIASDDRKRVAEMLPYGAPPSLASVLERALSNDPLQRQESAAELRLELELSATELGTLADRSGIGVFLRDLFPEYHEPLGAFEVSESNASGLDGMDLTYLFELRDPIIASEDVERAREALREMATGSRPLTPEHFSEPQVVRPPKPLVPSQPRNVIEKFVRVIPPRPAPRDRQTPTMELNIQPAPPAEEELIPWTEDETTEYAAPTPERVLRPVEEKLVFGRPRGIVFVPAPPHVARKVKSPVRRVVAKLVLFAVGIACGITAMRFFSSHAEETSAELESFAEVALLVDSPLIDSPLIDLPLFDVQRTEVPPIDFDAPPPSSHAISIDAGACEELVTNSGEDLAPLAAKLAPPPPPSAARPQVGRIDVRKPRGARIAINGAQIAKRVPIVGYRLPAGTHKITVTKRGWRRTYTVDLTPGGRVDLSP